MGFSKLQCDTAREIPITEFMKRSGYSPVKENQHSAWHLSPIRKENDASFKVSKVLNRWYDHGIGKGGNIIDLVIEMNNNCSVSDALRILAKNIPSFYFQQQSNLVALALEPEIQIDKILPIRHPALIKYLSERKIDIKTAARFASQVHYSMNQKRYFALGLENVSGGWELRNPYYKNAAAPKDFSYFTTGKQLLSVTEGMFDFFSLLMLYPGLPHQSDFLVLNSVSFINRIHNIVQTYPKVGLYLDNDSAGKKATKQLLADLTNSVDMSAIYKNAKDLNQLLIARNQRQRRSVW